MTEQQNEEFAAILNYFRNKAAELELANIELQLAVGKLQNEVGTLKARLEEAEADESSD